MPFEEPCDHWGIEILKEKRKYWSPARFFHWWHSPSHSSDPSDFTIQFLMSNWSYVLILTTIVWLVVVSFDPNSQLLCCALCVCCSVLFWLFWLSVVVVLVLFYTPSYPFLIHFFYFLHCSVHWFIWLWLMSVWTPDSSVAPLSKLFEIIFYTKAYPYVGDLYCKYYYSVKKNMLFCWSEWYLIVLWLCFVFVSVLTVCVIVVSVVFYVGVFILSIRIIVMYTHT